MKWNMLIVTVIVALAATFAVACGDDDDNGNGNGDTTPEATEVMDGETPVNGDEPENGDEPSNGDAPSGGGSGSATLTIGDQTYEFDNYYCATGSEETQNDRVSFSSGAFGELPDGTRTQLDVSIQDTEEQDRLSGEGTIHSVTLDDIDDFENPAVSWDAVTLFGSDFEIQIDGGNISAEAVFDDGTTDEIEEIPGTLEATCP